MDFKDKIQQLSERIEKQKDAIMTEEATKNAFIMPMIDAWGYDIFNPFEVIPEMDCDLTKKGDKIDYAIQKGDKTIILIECKHCLCNLNLHSTQLSKYYAASNARFGVLTNGIEYQFYADLDKVNIMDEKPFLMINILDMSDDDIEQLKKFHKSYFDESGILDSAQELKYSTEMKKILNSEFSNPSCDFVRFLAKQVYTSGQVTTRIIELFTPIIKKAINTIINDTIQDRLDLAEKSISANIKYNSTNEELSESSIEQTTKFDSSGIVTTEEELNAYNIVRSILCKHISIDDIVYKDTKSYFAIGIDNPSHCWICRIYAGLRKRFLILPVKNTNEQEWIEINRMEDLYLYTDKLEEALKYRLESNRLK